MLAMLRVHLHNPMGLLACVILLGHATIASADPKPLSRAEQAKVDKAIERGISYLKRVQEPSGVFPRGFRSNAPDNLFFIVGQALLPGLALLECGVPTDDPAIKKITALLRKSVSTLDSTYELSLAIMYLDKLGDRKDKETIRSLALRLVAGQSYTGGWTYHCPRLTAEQEGDLLKSLRVLQENLKADKPTPRGRAKREDGDAAPEVPATLAKLAVFQKQEKLLARQEIWRKQGRRSLPLVGETDNSNTQFAMLGLWTANRHDLPLVPTFRLLVGRFEYTQGDDGTWAYLYQFGGGRRGRARLPYDIADTGVGLLALAIGRATLQAERKTQERRDKQIIWGLTALNRDIGQPTDQPNYYLLWTIERVAALYNLQVFGDKDWYRWGKKMLVATQTFRGGWPYDPSLNCSVTGSWGNSLNTSFALLFLKRSNLAKDLTEKLPLKPEDLNKGIMALSGSSLSRDSSSPGKGTTRQRSPIPP